MEDLNINIIYRRKKSLEKVLSMFENCPISLLDNELRKKHIDITEELEEIKKFMKGLENDKKSL